MRSCAPLHSNGDEDAYGEFHTAEAPKRKHLLPVEDYRLPKAA